MRETRIQSLVRSLGRNDPLEKETATHSSTLAWKIPGWRSLVGYSPCSRQESDTTERLHFPIFLYVQCRDGYSHSHWLLTFSLPCTTLSSSIILLQQGSFCLTPLLPPGFPGGSVVKNLPANAEMRAKSLQSRPTLRHPMDWNLPGSFLHGILQARILEWVFTPFSRGSSQLMDRTHISYGSCIAGRFFTTEPQGKPHSSLYWFSKSTVAPKAHRFRLIVGI